MALCDHYLLIAGLAFDRSTTVRLNLDFTVVSSAAKKNTLNNMRINNTSNLPRTAVIQRDQILWRERGQENIHFSCSADHERQPYPVDPHSCYMCDHTISIHAVITYILLSLNHDVTTVQKITTYGTAYYYIADSRARPCVSNYTISDSFLKSRKISR